LFAVELAAITLVGCTKEIIVEKEVPVENEGETGSTLVKFALDANMVQTRTTADHGTLDPTDDENKIYNYALFIFKSNGMIEATLKKQSPGLDAPLGPDTNGLLTFDKDQNPDLSWNEDGDAIVISAGVKTFLLL
ncbi:MAG: hypothetical protein LIP05_03130, partial [Tannerellaceae bacterium]|nr:hypothetical protein [Tannerellaceae bacterium]